MPYRYAIDFDNDFDTHDTSEDISAYVQQASWSLGMGEPYQVGADVGALNLAVVNGNGAFNLSRTDGPFWNSSTNRNNLRRGAIVTVEYVNPSTGGTSPMWRGLITNILPEWTPSGIHTGETHALIQASTPEFFLQDNRQIQLGVQFNKTTGEIFEALIANAGLPPVNTNVWMLGVAGKSELGTTTILGGISYVANIAPGTLTLPVWMPNDEQTNGIWGAISELAQAERGNYYVDRAGYMTFVDRTSWHTTPGFAGTIGSEQVSWSALPTFKPTQVDYSYGKYVLARAIVRGQQFFDSDGQEETLAKLNGAWGGPANGTAWLFLPLADPEGRPVNTTGCRVENVVWSSGTGSIYTEIVYGNVAQVKAVWGPAGGTAVAFDLIGPYSYRDYKPEVRRDNAANLGLFSVAADLELDLPLISSARELDNIALAELSALWRGIEHHEFNRVTFRRRIDDTSTLTVQDWTIEDNFKINFPELGLELGTASLGNYFKVIGEQHTADTKTVDHTYILEWRSGQNPYR